MGVTWGPSHLLLKPEQQPAAEPLGELLMEAGALVREHQAVDDARHRLRVCAVSYTHLRAHETLMNL
eukprot:3851792-Prymnesium_polylepis.1